MSKFALFTDGSVFPEARRAGWAYYAESGGRILARNGVIDNCKDVSAAELAAVVHGLGAIMAPAAALGEEVDVVVYTDSLTVINWRSLYAKHKSGPLGLYMQRMRDLSAFIRSVDFAQMTPEKKHHSAEHSLVHCLARKAAKNLEIKSSQCPFT